MEIRNTRNTRHNEKDCYDSERKTQQDVVGIKEKSTYYPWEPQSPSSILLPEYL